MNNLLCYCLIFYSELRLFDCIRNKIITKCIYIYILKSILKQIPNCENRRIIIIFKMVYARKVYYINPNCIQRISRQPSKCLQNMRNMYRRKHMSIL